MLTRTDRHRAVLPSTQARSVADGKTRLEAGGHGRQGQRTEHANKIAQGACAVVAGAKAGETAT